MNREHLTIAASIAAGVIAAVPVFLMARQEPAPPPLHPPVQRAAVIEWQPELPDLTAEPAESSAEPSLTGKGEEQIQRRIDALAAELSRMWTRSPERLVRVIDRASRAVDQSPPVTLLLAIAHAETNGKILDVSEAGAVGLAQATPVAYRQERFTGRLFVTHDYVLGSRAYMIKKPLGDAYKIATVALERRAGSAERAQKLLRSALALRREGLEELDSLKPFAPDGFYDSIEAADRYNHATLQHLGELLEIDDREVLEAFRDRMKREYAGLREEQARYWKAYQRELVQRRDALLVARFGAPMKRLDEELVYEASEYLARRLDDRFSATHMAAFLVQHLETKRLEAQKLARASRNVERMTAALYNGGSHNVKRMLAGLIASLPETDRYMRKVPATRRRLDAHVALVEGAAARTDRPGRRAR
ncbi:MAG TPA: hypothetical protein VM779_11035 [Thermoanaerobaculia bacterium]|nr:hypothetical protein [Thermoanaerobaculia bacterium]